jgi:hypothetical protein
MPIIATTRATQGIDRLSSPTGYPVTARTALSRTMDGPQVVRSTAVAILDTRRTTDLDTVADFTLRSAAMEQAAFRVPGRMEWAAASVLAFRSISAGSV